MIWQRLRFWFPSPPGATPAEAAAFWRIRWAVCILVVGIFASGREQSSWPIMMWTIYSQKHYAFPETTTSAVELRAITQSGRTIVLRPHELYPMPYCQHVARRLIARVFAHEDSPQQTADRRYLARLVASRLPGEDVVAIEGWQRQWQVAPLAVPPVDREHPIGELRLGRFATRGSALVEDRE
jgi:hypothetical protein